MTPTTQSTIPSAWNPRKNVVVRSASARAGSRMFRIVKMLFSTLVAPAFVKAVVPMFRELGATLVTVTRPARLVLAT